MRKLLKVTYINIWALFMYKWIKNFILIDYYFANFIIFY